MRALLIDLDGVLYAGEESVPDAAEAVQRVQHDAIPHLFLTKSIGSITSLFTEEPRASMTRW